MGDGTAGTVAYQANVLQGLRATGPVVRVGPDVFAALVARNTTGVVVAATGRRLRANQYLTSYRGLLFTTSSRTPIPIPRAVEVIAVQRLHLPY